ncbi:hypothetical protein J6590_008411 [Homalodisca vitripennis]|nr:hypothetical protein J6590_008411 [Homalodisca vitripennis]
MCKFSHNFTCQCKRAYVVASLQTADGQLTESNMHISFIVTAALVGRRLEIPFRERNYDGERDRAGPQFRGPEGSIDFDISELKKFTIEIIRKSTGSNDDTIINRTITNPDDIAPVRRPDVYAEDYRYYNKGHSKGTLLSWRHRLFGAILPPLLYLSVF